MSEFQAIIFDCDGTLADTMPLHWKAWQEVAARHRILFSEDRFYELGGVPIAGFETYGEIALDAGDLSGFHNTTTVVLAIPR